MSDIVERLRATKLQNWALDKEAADEIERLRAQLKAQGEPVAWMQSNHLHKLKMKHTGSAMMLARCSDHKAMEDFVPLYLHPPKPDTEELEELRRERDDRLSDAKHYFEWLRETQAKLDACKQELSSTNASDREYIAVLEDRSNKYADQLISYRAVMAQAVEALERVGRDQWPVIEEALTALREVLKEE